METTIVTSDICTCGNKRLKDGRELDRIKGIRLIKILVIITCVACITSVLSCVYTVITMYRYQQIRLKDGQLMKGKARFDKIVSETGQQSTDEPRDDKSDYIKEPPEDISYDDTNLQRQTDYGSDKRRFLQPDLRLSGDPSIAQDSINSPVISAAHFVSAALDPKQGTWQDNCSNRWGGTVCINNTYWSANKKQTVEFLVPSAWMTSSHIPLNQTSPGKFRALQSGIYLLYLNMMIHADAVKNDIALYIRGTRVLDCRENLDIVPTRGTPFDASNRFINTKSKTCSISGVFHINAGDVINVKIETRYTPVVLRADATNFGAVLLMSGST